MYRKFFGLHKRPFFLSPDPEFYYSSRGHDLAFTHLEYGLVHNAGFVALTGEIGAGKTTLIKYLFDRGKTSVDLALILNTQVDALGLLEMIAREFELNLPKTGKSDLVNALYAHFMKQFASGNRCVIVVDEAQNLSIEAFEELRMLSNLNAGTDFLVQILLVGQPQLQTRLADPSLAQLTQRISVHYHLSPLSQDEVGDYIGHRLRVAGYKRPGQLFTGEAIATIAEKSKGIPRVINAICDVALTYAFADEQAEIPLETVEKVIADNQLVLAVSSHAEAAPKPQDSAGPRREVEPSLSAGALSIESLLAPIHNRLTALEDRLRAAETADQNKTVQVLQTMLATERERSLQYVQKITSLGRRCMELQKELETLKKDCNPLEEGSEPDKGWRVIGGKHD
jgi:general secretion pathway protein A